MTHDISPLFASSLAQSSVLEDTHAPVPAVRNARNALPAFQMLSFPAVIVRALWLGERNTYICFLSRSIMLNRKSLVTSSMISQLLSAM